jgi:hypothetical protein
MFQHVGGINQLHGVVLSKIQAIYRYTEIYVRMVFKIDVNKAGYMFLPATKV